MEAISAARRTQTHTTHERKDRAAPPLTAPTSALFLLNTRPHPHAQPIIRHSYGSCCAAATTHTGHRGSTHAPPQLSRSLAHPAQTQPSMCVDRTATRTATGTATRVVAVAAAPPLAHDDDDRRRRWWRRRRGCRCAAAESTEAAATANRAVAAAAARRRRSADDRSRACPRTR